MIDASTFLAELAETRQVEQARARAGFALPPDFTLPQELEIAIRHGWKITPVLSQSSHISQTACVGVPSSRREDIEYWAANHTDANWALHTGDSAVAALEIDNRLASHSLAGLCRENWSWQRTLQFQNGNNLFALFKWAPGPGRFQIRHPGLRLHAGGPPILIPPSIVRTNTLEYSNPFAPLLTLDWLSGHSLEAA